MVIGVVAKFTKIGYILYVLQVPEKGVSLPLLDLFAPD